MPKRVTSQEGNIELILADSTSNIDLSNDTSFTGVVNVGPYLDVDGATGKVVIRSLDSLTYDALTPGGDPVSDPQFGSVTFLASFEGNTAGAESFIPEIGPEMEWNLVSGSQPSQVDGEISTAQAKYGAKSLFNKETSGAPTAGWQETAASNSGFAFSGDFTIEMDVYIDDDTSQTELMGKWDFGDRCWTLSCGNTGDGRRVNFAISTTGSNQVGIFSQAGTSGGTTGIPFQQWAHVAICRQGTNWYCFIDGVATSTTPVSNATAIRASNSPLVIGQEYTDVGCGTVETYYDNIRITDGVARYTTGFTPPSAPYQGSAQDNVLTVASTSHDRVSIADGVALRVNDLTGTDYVDFSHDGTDFNITGTNTTDLNFTGFTNLTQAGNNILTAIDVVPGTTDNSLIRWDASSSRWQETTNFGIHEGDQKLAMLWSSDAQLQWTTDPSDPGGATVYAFVGYDTGNRLRISENLGGGDIGIYAGGNLLGLFNPTGDTLIRGEVTGLRLTSGGTGLVRIQPGGADRVTFNSSGIVNLLGNGTQSGVLNIVEGTGRFSINAGESALWVRDDDPNTLLWSNDTNDTVDWTLTNTVSEVEYQYDSTVTAADPGAGLVRFDSVTIGSIANMYIDDVANTADDQDWWLSNLAAGDVLTIRDAADPADYIVASVTSAPTDNTGWWTVPLTLIHTGTIFTNNSPLRISVQWLSSAIGASGNIGGSITDNQIAVGAATANDIEGSAEFTWDVSTGILTIGDVGSADTITMQNDGTDFNIIGTDNEIRLLPNSDQIGLECIVNAGVRLYTNNTLRAQSANDGFEVINSGTDFTTSNVLTFSQSNFTVTGEVGFNTTVPNNALTVESFVNGGEVILKGRNTGGTAIFFSRADETSTDVWASSEEVKRTYGGSVQTTDATQTEILATDAIGTDQFIGFEVYVIGTETATGDSVYERVFGAIINDAGVTTLVGSNITERTDDAGASGWTITVAADDTADTLTVDVTGEAAHTIDWKCRVELMEV